MGRVYLICMTVFVAICFGVGLWARHGIEFNDYNGKLDNPCNGDATCDYPNLVCRRTGTNAHYCQLKSESAQ